MSVQPGTYSWKRENGLQGLLTRSDMQTYSRDSRPQSLHYNDQEVFPCLEPVGARLSGPRWKLERAAPWLFIHAYRSR